MFDAVIVGSGFGGSVMSYRLAQAGLSVCVLERGKAWPPRSFPRTPLQFKQALWDPSEGGHGLYHVWWFRNLAAVVSSGLGGGSLIYANVLLRKDERWFAETVDGRREPWPVTYADLERHYRSAEEILSPIPYPKHLRKTTPKTRAFVDAGNRLALEPFYPPLAITFSGEEQELGRPFGQPRENVHDAQRYTCRLVGECDAGCNFGSKNSLDFTYLAHARDLGAEIRTRQEVKAFERAPNGAFKVEVVDHGQYEEGHKREGSPPRYVLESKRLILSAGALGTPYLLLANRSQLPGISPRLGTRFCGNGDYVAFARRCRTTADGKRVPRTIEPTRGPVITAAIRIGDALDEDGHTGRGFYLEDGGYPQFGAWVSQLLNTPRVLASSRSIELKLLWKVLTNNPVRDLSFDLSELFGSREVSWGTMVLLGMGREVPQGRMHLRGGMLDIEWSRRVAKPYFDSVRSRMGELAEAMGGRLGDNVLSRYLKTVVAAHPVGGCPMGASHATGVVDPATGEVYGYPGLHVADGSVLPGPVGANPSLTIAAVADRFAEGILALEGRL